MRLTLLPKFVLAAVFFVSSSPSASAQSAPDSAAVQNSGRTASGAEYSNPVSQRDSASHSKWAWFRKYPWNGANVWAGSSVQTRSASHNEKLNGFFRIVGVQVTRDLARGTRFKLSYVGEVLPAIFVQSSASTTRIQRQITVALTAKDSANLPRFYLHDSFGVGLAPFGLELTSHLAGSANFIMNTTAGGVLFNHIVPYGFGTKPNFTVSPGAAFQWQRVSHTGIALGYTFHHLSNMSFGRANPGMNSHVFYLRVTKAR